MSNFRYREFHQWEHLVPLSTAADSEHRSYLLLVQFVWYNAFKILFSSNSNSISSLSKPIWIFYNIVRQTPPRHIFSSLFLDLECDWCNTRAALMQPTRSISIHLMRSDWRSCRDKCDESFPIWNVAWLKTRKTAITVFILMFWVQIISTSGISVWCVQVRRGSGELATCSSPCVHRMQLSSSFGMQTMSWVGHGVSPSVSVLWQPERRASPSFNFASIKLQDNNQK